MLSVIQYFGMILTFETYYDKELKRFHVGFF